MEKKAENTARKVHRHLSNLKAMFIYDLKTGLVYLFYRWMNR